MNRKITLGVALGAVAVFLAGCASSAAPSGDASEPAAEPIAVDLSLDWTWGSQHLGYLVADELGYFEEEGLDVTITEGEGSAVTGTVVATGDAEFGVMAAGEVLVANSNDLGVQAIYTVLQSSPTSFVFNKDVYEMEEATDLYGHVLGVTTQSTAYKEFSALADSLSLDKTKFTEVAVGAQLVTAMLSDQVDTIVGFSTGQYPQLLLEGKNVGLVRFADLGFPDSPSATVVVNKDFAAASPDAVAGFASAVDRGWQYVVENPEEAIALMAKARPEVSEQFVTESLPLFLELMGDPSTFGSFDEERWGNLLALYEAEGLLARSVELEGDAYTTEFLK